MRSRQKDQLYGSFGNKLEEIYKGKINFNNVSNDGSSSDSPQQAYEKHPLRYHTRILNEEIAQLNLKSNDSLLSDLDINSVI